MNRKPTYKFWVEFIKLYESQPCLWNNKLESYKRRKDRQLACMILLRKMREIEPEADIHMVKQKINSFRTRYIEKRRNMQSDSSGGVQVGEWVYYKHFSFLDECLDPLEVEGESWNQCYESKIEKYEPLSMDDVDENAVEMNATEAWHSTANNTEEINRELSSPVDTPNLQDLAVHQEFWIEFIKLYESKPELWKYSNEAYKDRIFRQKSFDELVEKLREIEPNADVDMVRRKINSFRNIYRRELRKKDQALKRGKPEPVINWIYFDYFSFLQNKDSSDNDYNSHKDGNEYESMTEDNVEEKYARTRSSSMKITKRRSRSRPFSATDLVPNLLLTGNQEFWIEFIELYKSKPELWQHDSDGFKDRDLRRNAFNELAEKLREVEPNADVALAKKKIINFRYSFKRALRKKENALRLGYPEPAINWFYFDYLSFLQDENPLDDDCNSYEDDHVMKLDNNYEEDNYEHLSQDNVEEKDAKTIASTMKITRVASLSTAFNGEEFNRDLSSPIDSQNFRRLTANQKFWVEFIELYKSKPELWQHGSDRIMKRNAYNVLLEKLREVEPNADVELVRRKINGFRFCYKRALRKKEQALRLGKPEPNINWFYFNYLSFLQNKNSLHVDYNPNEDEHIMTVDKTCDEDKGQSNFEEIDTVNLCLSPEHNSKRAFQSPTPDENPKRLCTESLDIMHKHIQQPSDEADILGIGWAYQYRHLSEKQKLFAKKAIDDILFEARLETLNRDSVKINASNCEKCACKLKLDS